MGSQDSLFTKFKTTRFGKFLREQRFLRAHSSERSFYRQLIAKGDLVFDVGANVGNKTSVFRSLGARVVCFEPQSFMCSELERRFRHDSKVTIERVALGARAGQGAILVCSDLPAISTLAESSLTRGRFAEKLRNASAHIVRIETVEEMILRHGRPRFCKIDVEGFELQVLHGLLSRISMISLEVNIEFLAEIKQCTEYLHELGLIRFNFSAAETNSFVFMDWLDRKDMAQFLESQTDPLFWGDLYARVA